MRKSLSDHGKGSLLRGLLKSHKNTKVLLVVVFCERQDAPILHQSSLIAEPLTSRRRDLFVAIFQGGRVDLAMKTTSRYLASAIAILSFGLPLLAQPQTTSNAKSILDNMFKAYSRLSSYQDEGIVIETRDEPTGGTIEKMPFKTSFRRPNMFRFEWTDYGITKLGRTHIVWSNGKEAFTYWEPDRYEKEKSLGLAVAGASGVSSGTAWTVSSLLLPEEISGATWKKQEKVSLAGEEVVDGVSSYHLKAVFGDGPLELWVGKTDFLVRKLRRERKYDDVLRITEESRRKIQVNHSLPDVAFNYKPPIELTPVAENKNEEIERLLNPGPPIWTEFRSEAGRFTVLMPQKPVSQASTFETPQGRFEQHAFTAVHSTLVCIVGYIDVPSRALVGNDVDGFFQGARDEFVKEIGGKLGSESTVTLDGHPGRELRVIVFRGEVRMRLFLVRDRLYQLSLITMDKNSEIDEETFRKFFGSFKLNPITKSIAALEVGRSSLNTHL